MKLKYNKRVSQLTFLGMRSQLGSHIRQREGSRGKADLRVEANPGLPAAEWGGSRRLVAVSD